jgi:hypothetical protein
MWTSSYRSVTPARTLGILPSDGEIPISSDCVASLDPNAYQRNDCGPKDEAALGRTITWCFLRRSSRYSAPLIIRR